MKKDEGSTQHELKTLIISYQPIILVETVEEERASRLIRQIAQELDLAFFEWSVTRGLRKSGQRAAFHGTGKPLTLLQHIAGLTIDAVFVLKDFVQYLENAEVRRQCRELAQAFSGRQSSLLLIEDGAPLPSDLRHHAVNFRLSLPGKEEMRAMLRDLIQSLREKETFQIDLSPDDLERLLLSLSGLTLKQARQTMAYAILSDRRLSVEDIQKVLEKKGESIRNQGLLEYYPPASNQYELGGFGKLKEWLQRSRIGFSEKASALGLSPPKGILLVGVQGCGKSLAAKVIAREWGLPLLKLDASRLFDKYIGESEKNFRKATFQAESMAPSVLWIDEIEKSFSTGGGDADGGVSTRILGSFLTWMQEKDEGVFLVATANNLEALPPEMLRKGRFDEIFFVDLPSREEREVIFSIHLKLRSQDPQGFDLERLANESEGFSGAEIEQAVISSLYGALHSGKDLSTERILEEIRSTVPLSVSRREDIQALRKWASERFVSVS